MRVLAHIHTFNDAGVIEQALSALLRQTRTPDGIILVDNGSTDETLNRTFPDGVTVIRHTTNLGMSGAIRSGFSYALEHSFDWIWLLDPDSVPEPDALEKLLAFYERLSPPSQAQVCFIVSRVAAMAGKVKHEPLVFTGSGGRAASPEEGGFSRCDCALWSGSLYRVAAVAKIGLPGKDYFADWSELEYTYRAWAMGYVSYVVHDSLLHQDIGRSPGMATRLWRLGPLKFRLFDPAPFRCYYFVRNAIHFWLHVCKERGIRTLAHVMLFTLGFTLSFVIRPVSGRRQLIACLRGIRDGLTMHIERRY